MPDRRVAVTGLGVVTALGIGIEPFWEALLAGKSGVREIALFDGSEFPCRWAGELQDFSARQYVPKDYRKAVKVMARDIEIAVAAADTAFRDSGIVTAGIDPQHTTIESHRLGCNIGAGLICSDIQELGTAATTSLTDGKFDLKIWGARGMTNLTPLWLLKYLPNMLACHVTIIHQATGPSNTITCGDPSGQLAVGEASRYILRGAVDAAVAGGAESKHNPMGLLRQGMLGRLCTSCDTSASDLCKPFGAEACGTVIGEGGGLLIIEDMERARKRGARIYAELIGFGAACDPKGIDVITANVGGLDLAVKRAIADAGISANDIGCLIAHGTCVPAEDALEVQAWKHAMGPSVTSVPAAAITGGTGSMFAGAGAVELAVAAMALHTQTIPPTRNYGGGAELNLSQAARKADFQYAVSGSFTVGGQSGACVLKRYTA